MPPIPKELLFPNAWLRRRQMFAATRLAPAEDGTEHVRISRGRGGASKTVYEGPLEGAAAHVPNRAWVVTGLPCQRSVTRLLNPPVKSLRTAASLVDGLLDTEVPFALDEAQHATPELAKRKGKVEALAVAARKKDIEEHLAPMQAVGLDPQLVDHEGLALWTQSLHEKRGRKDGRARALAWCEADRTLVIFGRGKQFVHAQSIAAGIDDPSFPERLDRALRARYPGEESVDWRVAGPLAKKGQALPMAFESAVRHRHPDRLLDRALLRRALRPSSLPCNLRTDHPRLSEARNRRNRFTSMHLLIPGLLLWALVLGWGHLLKQREAKLQTELSQAAEAITGYKVPKGQEVLLAQRALAQRTDGPDVIESMLRPAADQQLSNALNFARRNNMHVDKLTFKEGTLRLTGQNVLPLERKLGELRQHRPKLVEDKGRFDLTLHAAREDGVTP